MIDSALSHINTTSSGIKTRSNSYLSPILLRDKKLLQKLVQLTRSNSENYEDSWGYIIQATRYGGFKWHDPDTGTLIFFGKKSESDPTLVVPNFFASPSVLKKIIKRIQNELNAPQTILKNVNYKDISRFTSYGFRTYHDDERWSTFARFDDQTNPQLLVDLQKVVDLKGKAYHHLRKALRKNPNAIIRRYKDSDRDELLRLFYEKDKGMLRENQKYTIGMYSESHAMYPKADIDKFVVIDTITSKIIGFTAYSDINTENAAFVSLLFKSNVGVASVWGIYQTLLDMYKKGYKKINFGGSETEGTYNFVNRTFKPVKEIHKTHLIFEE